MCYNVAALLTTMIIGDRQELPCMIAIKLVIAVLLVIGAYYKTFQYKLIIIQQYDYIELVISKKYKTAAKKLFVHLKRRISTGKL
jgi:hypothetical protein